MSKNHFTPYKMRREEKSREQDKTRRGEYMQWGTVRLSLCSGGISSRACIRSWQVNTGIFITKIRPPIFARAQRLVILIKPVHQGHNLRTSISSHFHLTTTNTNFYGNYIGLLNHIKYLYWLTISFHSPCHIWGKSLLTMQHLHFVIDALMYIKEYGKYKEVK